jgi:hypothetical protein
MYTFENYKYFLLLVDAFSSKVFIRPLKAKSGSVVKKAFEDIFKQFKAQIYVLQTDRGKGYNCIRHSTVYNILKKNYELF